MTEKRKSNVNKSDGGSFQSLNLSPPIFAGIKKLGYRTPTPVQRKSLPILLTGKDAVVMARTGSGKTVAFLVPVLERLLAARGQSSTVWNESSKSAFAVILSPTRELSVQTLKVLRSLGHYCSGSNKLNFIGINGGESMEKQFTLLSSHPDIIVATPGRLAHHLSEIPDFHLRHCEIVVFDEADRLFEMGFALQLRQICSTMTDNRQTMLFSATMPKALIEFTKTGMMHDPTVIRLDNEVQVSEELRIGFITCKSAEKDAVLLHLVRDVLSRKKGTDNSDGSHESDEERLEENEKRSKGEMSQKHVGKYSKRGLTLIFAATRHHVEYVALLLQTSGLSATYIYGNMDNTARQQNLNSFRSGKCPILVVTDVAARGIDIPLIDHVIHFAFPPSAKLFVHRSGRAARAGRIGYCWGIVDPEELPYMVDLHLFLGRKMCTAYSNTKIEDSKHIQQLDEKNEETQGNDKNDEEMIYELEDMTPDMVHYGSVPEMVLVEETENVRRMVDSEIAGSINAETLKNLSKVCMNAMKQYRKSRPEASREGVRRAKALLEGDKESSGKRVFHSYGGIPPHPLLRGIEIERLRAVVLPQSSTSSSSALLVETQSQENNVEKKISDLKRRQEFLMAMANFRPKETVFETFATGGGKDLIYSSQVDRCANVNAAALVAMKNMRRQMRIARDKGIALVVAGSKSAQMLNGELFEDNLNLDTKDFFEQTEHYNHDLAVISKRPPSSSALSTNPQSKRHLSKAERRKMKKCLNENLESSSNNDPLKSVETNAILTSTASIKAKNKKSFDFRDNLHFIEYDSTPDTAAAARDRQIEAAMQPSASSNGKGSISLAHRIEENMLDIVGDENIDLVKRQRMMRWDKSKRKYIQTTVGEELSGDSKSKKMKLESGRLMKRDTLKLGDLYEKWQKKTNRSIGRVGVFDDVTEDVGIEIDAQTKKFQKGEKDNRNKNFVKGNESKSVAVIKKERDMKEKMRIKNMKKSDRRQFEHKKHKEKIIAESSRRKGYQGKKGTSGRWNKKK